MYADGTWNNLAGAAPPLPSLVEFPPALPAPPLVVLRRAGQTDIPATTIALANAQTLVCAFDLSGAAHGAWDVVLTNPDGGVSTIAGGLIVDNAPLAGPIGCVRFDGNLDLAKTADDPLLAIGTQQTLEGWFRTTDSSIQTVIMADIALPPLYPGINISMVSGLVNAGGYTGPGWLSNFTGTSAIDDQWHHVACVIDGVDVTTYLDGVPTGPLAGGGTFSSAIGQIVFGGRTDAYPFAGDIAEVRAWSTALPGDVIAAWRGTRASPSHPYWASLQAEFRCDDGSPGYALDSVHGINALFSGSPQWTSGLVFVSGTAGVPITGTLAGSDADGDPLTYQLVAQAASGTALITAATGAYTYTPHPGVSGFDRFTYRVSDGYVWSEPVQVNIRLAPVGPVTPTITWATPSFIYYGTALSAQQLDASADVPGSFAYAPALGAVLGAGASVPLVATFTPTDTVDYTTATDTVFLSVAQKPLSISPTSLSATAGTLPVLGFTTSGLSGSDAVGSATLATTATTASPPGTYPITVSAAVFTSGSAANYDITYAGGTLTLVAGSPPNPWSPIGSGVGPDQTRSFGLCAGNGNLYLAGTFASVDGVAASNIAAWNGTAWSPLGAGLDGGGDDIRILGSSLFEIGKFTTAGGATAQNVASWDGAAWSALGSGVGNYPYASAIYNGHLYVGGGSPAFLTMWDGAAWQTIANGTSGFIYSMCAHQGKLVVAGAFGGLGGAGNDYLVSWDGSQFATLGSGYDALVNNVASDSVSLFASGDFTMAGGVAASHVARWDGTAWNALGTGLDAGANLVASPAGLYALGGFQNAGGQPAAHAAYWNGQVWTPMGAGTDDAVYCAAPALGGIAAAGIFTHAGGLAANGIALYTPPATSAPALSWAAPAPITYGTLLSATQLDASASVPGTFQYSPGLGALCGTATLQRTVTFVPTDTVTYSSVSAAVPITVAPAPLTIAALNASMAQGAALPTLTDQVSGLVGSDTIASVQISTSATAGSPAGAYPITVSQAVFGSGSAANYILTYTPGILTITAGTTPGAPVIAGVLAVVGSVSQAFSYQVVASNAPTSYAATGLPPGLQIDASSGLISGTPTQSGTYTVALSATNAAGSGVATLNLAIAGSSSGGGGGCGGGTGSAVILLMTFLYGRRRLLRR